MLVRLYDRALHAIAILGLAALLATVLLAVVSRAAGDPVIWTDEGSRILMIWLAAIGWIITSRRRGHIRIRFFAQLCPPSARRAMELVIQAAITLLGLGLAWYGGDLVLKNLDIEATTLPVSIAILYVPVVLVGLTVAGQGAHEFRQALGQNPAEWRDP